MLNLPTIGKYLRARLDGVGARGKRDPVCFFRASAVALTFASFFLSGGTAANVTSQAHADHILRSFFGPVIQ
jgi:hypothetical protein